MFSDTYTVHECQVEWSFDNSGICIRLTPEGFWTNPITLSAHTQLNPSTDAPFIKVAEPLAIRWGSGGVNADFDDALAALRLARALELAAGLCAVFRQHQAGKPWDAEALRGRLRRALGLFPDGTTHRDVNGRQVGPAEPVGLAVGADGQATLIEAPAHLRHAMRRDELSAIDLNGLPPEPGVYRAEIRWWGCVLRTIDSNEYDFGYEVIRSAPVALYDSAGLMIAGASLTAELADQDAAPD